MKFKKNCAKQIVQKKLEKIKEMDQNITILTKTYKSM